RGIEVFHDQTKDGHKKKPDDSVSVEKNPLSQLPLHSDRERYDVVQGRRAREERAEENGEERREGGEAGGNRGDAQGERRQEGEEQGG
ncbi:hypothetical protein CSUI_007262, partial [Cystoisospora suis]